MTKSAKNWGFVHIYWTNPWWKTSFFCAVAECNTKLILNLKPFYDCSQPLHLKISGYPSLKNCSHSMLQQEAGISTFCGEILQYSPVDTTFPIHYSMLETVYVPTTIYHRTMYHRHCKAQSLLMPSWLCLQTGLNYTMSLDRNDRKFTKVSDTHW